MPRDLVIEKRSLKAEEITLLIEEVKNTPFIVGYAKDEWKRFGQVYVASYKNDFAGICVELDLDKDWGELANLIVLEKYRGLGIGKELFDQVFNSFEKRGKNIYIVSRNPRVLKMMKERSMIMHKNFFRLPLTVQLHVAKVGLHFFRISEYIRKFFKYLNFFQWVYGTKINKR